MQLHFSHVAYQKEALEHKQKALARLEEARPLAPQELELRPLQEELGVTAQKLQVCERLLLLLFSPLILFRTCRSEKKH